jgi:hypothetical protein
MTFKRKLTELEKSIQTWVKIAPKTKQNNQKLTELQELLPLLKEAVQKEEKALDIKTDEQINSGYQTQETTEAVVDPKYKDIKEIQQYLYEDNIRDTNPILILSFNKLISLTIDYLQNLEGMLNVISANSHEKDSINISVKEAILELFSGNEVNSYELNLHIRTVLGESIDEIFNGLDSMPLTFFCTGLVDQIQLRLIKIFKTTSKKELKKDFGKKFRKHKKGPYPSVSKILRAIDLNDVPHNVQGDVDKERRINNLASWYKSFRQQLDIFEQEHKTDFLNDALLQQKLKEFGSSLTDIKITPPSCKLHLADNIVNKLGTKSIVKALDLISIIKTELEALRLKIKASIEDGSFKGNDDIDHFLGIKADGYFDCIKTALKKNRFDEYKKIITDWITSMDEILYSLATHEERGKYNYKSKLVALNLSKLFKVEDDLIDFSSFIQPILKGVKASGFSMELSEIYTLVPRSAYDPILKNLINWYNTAVEKGTLDYNLDTLKIALPNKKKIAHAILSAKIDLILNRDIKDLTFNYNFAWVDRSKIITMLVDTIVKEADIAALCQNLITIIENATSGNDDDDNGETPPDITSDSWLDWAKGILKSLTELPQKLADVLIQTVRAYFVGTLSSLTAIVTQIRDFLEGQLGDRGVLNIPDELTNTSTEIYFPLSLNLDEDKDGNFLPYLTLKSSASQTDTWSILEDGNYYKLEATALSSEIGNVSGFTIPSKLKLKIRFTDPGYSISTGVSALFISAGVSTTKDEYDEDIELEFSFDSTYNKGKNQVDISNITFSNVNTILLQKNRVENNNLLNENLSTSVLTKGADTKIKAFI